MSKSSFIKLVLFASVFCLPKFASAKTLQLADQTWDVTQVFGKTVDAVSIRNNFDLKEMTSHALLGTRTNAQSLLLDPLTAQTINDIAVSVDQKTIEPKLVIENKIAKKFEPGQGGQSLDVFDLRKQLASNETTILLPMVSSSPTKNLGDTNDLGIKELVAVGESNFVGSPKNRLHNIQVGAAKYNGLIIDQGQEFSFNQYLGDVDAEHGFLPELVIKATGVVPEFGGGLCQVSSTAFRAAMNAGAPITARRNHSFAVQYYAPQGTDATIYPGVQDMKFINNLPSAMLIRTRIEGTKLYFEYYGTKDTRVVTFEGPVVYDKQANGAMKATWTRHVTLAGATTDQIFKSVYQSPALFHKEEQTSTPNPDTVPTSNNQPVTPATN